MSVDDVEIVRRFREAAERRDAESGLAMLASDIEWVTPRRTLHGIRAVRRVFEGSSHNGYEHLEIEEERGEPRDLRDGRVATENRIVYRWKETGDVAHERRARIEYTVREGRIARYEARIFDA